MFMLKAVWRRIAPVLLSVMLCAWSGPADAAEAVRTAPAWPWVSELTLPKPNPTRARQHSEGLGFLLADRQTRAEPGGDTTYRRGAYEIVDRSGLEEGASLTINFSPARETLVLHHARVLRNGAIVDLLAKARIQVVANEDELANGVVTGMKTARIEFEDVRVGDIVDYGYSWISRDPLTPTDVYANQNLSWAIPVEVTRFRLLWPQGSRPTIMRHGGVGAPTTGKAGAWDVYEWVVRDGEPDPDEKDIPNGVTVGPRIEVSSQSNWAQVVGLALPLYAGHRTPAAWKGEVARIAAIPDPNRRVTEAIRLVQDKVRYVSLSIGAGAYRPRSPDTVVASGYGDCKDKALLLSLVLRELGFDAAPALTDADEGPGLPTTAPSMASFDHVIVRIRMGGQTYWVDATGSHEGGVFPRLARLRYAWALPIVAGQRALERVPRPEAAVRNSDVLERYELPADARQALKLEVTTVFADLEADYIRGQLATSGLGQTEKKYLDYYSEMYPGLTVLRPLQVTDDRDANLVTLREAYEVPRRELASGGMLEKFRIRGGTLETYAKPAVTARRAPLWLPWPINKRHTIQLVTPGKRPPAPPETEVSGEAFRLSTEATRKGDVLTIRYALVGLLDTLPAAKVPDHRAKVTELNDAVYWDVDLTSNAGGTIGDDALWYGVFGILAALALYVGIIVAAMRYGGRADDGWAADGPYYPVTTAKFALMSLATAGLYAYFWLWKNWRWARLHGSEDVSPFWRTFFSLFWVHALFQRINAAAGERRLPDVAGIAAAAGYILWLVIWTGVEAMDVLPKGLGLASLLAPAFLLPLVIAAQRANADRPEVLAANSRHTGLSWAAVAAGLTWWALVLVGEFAA
jgi:transglutaminase-like putative cysteine protease